MRRFAVVLAIVVTAASTAGSVAAATTKTCRPVVNPYPGTRYADVNLSHIRTTGVSCVTARAVARGAHRRALGLGPPVSPIRRFTWHGWQVSGDLRPASDIYVAKRGRDVVRWRF